MRGLLIQDKLAVSYEPDTCEVVVDVLQEVPGDAPIPRLTLEEAALLMNWLTKLPPR